MPQQKTKQITITKNGPYIVTGAIPLRIEIIGVNEQKISVEWIEGKTFPAKETYALCRCGASKNAPYCDGSHENIGFEGSETASRSSFFDRAEVIDGPQMALLDDESLCAFARFCDANGRIWNETALTDDPSIRETFIKQAGYCSAGRLVAWDKKTGKAIDPTLDIAIAVTEDPAEDCSGPLWLQGGIPVIADDGFQYELRNRITLCRCGASSNKPFCDGSHVSINFKDGIS